MIKILKVVSIISFLTCLFSSLDVNASLKKQFKEEQKGKGNCSYETSKWYGWTFYKASINDARFCFSGDIYTYYDQFFPNGRPGGKLNKKVKKWDQSLRGYYITELALNGDYFVEYKCKSSINSSDCVEPVSEKAFALRDYLAFHEEGITYEDMWLRDQDNANLLQSSINSYTKSIDLNPLNNEFRKSRQVMSLYKRAEAFEQAAFMTYGTNLGNPNMKGNKYHKRAIQDITNAKKIADNNKTSLVFDKGYFLNLRGNYKFGYYEDIKYACDDWRQARNLGNSYAQENFEDSRCQ